MLAFGVLFHSPSQVPDRGGRPTEATPPPPEMPSFRKRTEGPRGKVGDQKLLSDSGVNYVLKLPFNT